MEESTTLDGHSTNQQEAAGRAQPDAPQIAMDYDPEPARMCTRLVDSIYKHQEKRGRERTAQGTRSAIMDGCKHLQELAESLQDGTYDLKYDNQQAADFHLKYCCCNTLRLRWI